MAEPLRLAARPKPAWMVWIKNLRTRLPVPPVARQNRDFRRGRCERGWACAASIPPASPYVKCVTSRLPRRRYGWAGRSSQYSSEGGSDEDTTNGVLVVQVRGLGAS